MNFQLNSIKKQYRYLPVIIFFINLIIYSLFNYGGIRSPDSEIVFRTTESLVLRNDFSVPEAINWRNFGLAPGKDSKLYSIFGPGESVLAVPLLALAIYMEKSEPIIDSALIPVSFLVPVDNEVAGVYFIEGKRPPNLNGQYVRFIVSFFNSFIGALSAVFFYYVLLGITKSKIISFYTAFLYSFGSLIFSYTGTFFSEPLCTMFMILSFLFIIKNETTYEKIRYTGKNYFYSGLFLGLAIATHISAVLSVPFFYMFIMGQIAREKFILKRFWNSSLYFTLGLIIFCGLLLYYNYARFGNIFETGRSATNYHYAIYSNPLSGLYGLLFSPGKGLFIYSPIVFLSIIFWKSFHRTYPHLSIAILGMILIRLFFIASRSDWHGGFCLGPRYFVIIMPFLLIPVALGIKNILLGKKPKYFFAISLFGLLCILQQLFFSTGEVFSFLHIIYQQQKDIGINILVHDALYLNWQFSPALYLLNYKTGPFIPGIFSANNYMLWISSAVGFSIMFIAICCSTYRSFKANFPDRTLSVKINPGTDQ